MSINAKEIYSDVIERELSLDLGFEKCYIDYFTIALSSWFLIFLNQF